MDKNQKQKKSLNPLKWFKKPKPAELGKVVKTVSKKSSAKVVGPDLKKPDTEKPGANKSGAEKSGAEKLEHNKIDAKTLEVKKALEAKTLEVKQPAKKSKLEPAPKAKAPEEAKATPPAKALEVKKPDAKASEAQAPAKKPEVKQTAKKAEPKSAVEAKAPEAKASSVKTPEAKTSEVKTPEVKTSATKAEPKTQKSKPPQQGLDKPNDSPSAEKKDQVELSGLYAFKLAMSSIYDEKGQFTPVTFLEFKPWLVSQVKKKDKEGYNSVQVVCMPQKGHRVSKAIKTHLKPAGLPEGARYIREIPHDLVENIKPGQEVAFHSLKKGDRVSVQSLSKGHGFAGVVKRWGFRGGPASHGSKTHRTSGSVGNCTEPARVMPGKKMAGHYGVEKTRLKNVQVVDMVSHLGKKMIMVKGPVPGARNSLVYLRLQQRPKH